MKRKTYTASESALLATSAVSNWLVSVPRRFLKRTTLFGAVFFTMLQILPVKRITNPAGDSARSIEAGLNMPAPIENILNAACKDCETRWPWYAKVAPVSWMLTRDVERARRAMNLSEWTAQAAKPGIAIGYLTAACAGVESNHMPPAAYKRLHADAYLGRDEVSALCDWTTAQAVRIRAESKRRPQNREGYSVDATTPDKRNIR